MQALRVVTSGIDVRACECKHCGVVTSSVDVRAWEWKSAV